ncbi:LacI family transcriptional regulator [Yinghuangia sp. ASG 101]|uniref:LacI family DNA-binding transcriptional regulator n=1 Tax=Yinghuangia sp. ASG 101 TaxID=2896848 RepID=UPI001E305BA9|nr:LacI family DNA-binding transcriptional regulator [Yinghuangia sp. ASG 101]UGQ12345.1 LacI family transcriptional regulator [Yinghuangia sp. ASG 101]
MTRPVKRITSKDVARAAGVSQTTVSFVLNKRAGHAIPEETQRRVLEAARRLDYRPHASARSLAAGRSDIVLLSVPDLPIGSSISRFVEQLAAALADHGLTLVTHLAGAHGRPLPDVCASVGATAVLGLGAFDADTVQTLYRAGADVVLPTEAEDAEAMRPIGRLQAEHLIGRGHRRLGYALPGHRALLPMARERLAGVADACAEAGLAPPFVADTTLDVAVAAEAVAAWRREDATGVCAFNDETAIAVLAGMREHGLTAPGDIAVVGVDDTPAAPLVAPPLTSVAFDLREVARRRAVSLAAALAGEQRDVVPEGELPLEARVVRRASA